MVKKNKKAMAQGPAKSPAANQASSHHPTAAPLRPLVLALGLLGLFVALALVRLPFISRPLVGEETHFAFLAVDNGHDKIDPHWIAQSASKETSDPTHDFLYLARVKGQVVWGPAEHPVPSYLLITKLLRRWTEGSQFDSMNFDERSRTARVRFFACFLAALALLLATAWSALRGSDRHTALLAGGVIAFALTAPLMVGASVQPQMDGSIGLMWVGAAALCLHAAPRRRAAPVVAALAVVAGFASCLGKNEWAMAMFGAAAAGLALHFLLRRFAPDPDAPRPGSVLALFLGIMGGVVLGSLASCLIDPWNYLHGLDVMRRTQAASFAKWAETFQARLPWIWPDFVLLAAALAAAAAGLRRLALRQAGHLALLIWSLALLAGFLISSWPGDNFPRYFCTSIFGLTAFLVVFLPRLGLPSAVKIGALALLVVGIAINLIGLAENLQGRTALGSLPGKSLDAHVNMLARTQAQVNAAGQPIVTDLNFGYYFPTMDFIANIVPPEQAAELLRK